MPWSPTPEMMWSVHPDITAARSLTGWGEFHRACGRRGLAFDHPKKSGRREWTVDAFTWDKDRVTRLLVTGTGKTVVDAVADGFARAGILVPDAEPWLDRMRGVPAADDDSFESLLGDSFEELL